MLAWLAWHERYGAYIAESPVNDPNAPAPVVAHAAGSTPGATTTPGGTPPAPATSPATQPATPAAHGSAPPVPPGASTPAAPGAAPPAPPAGPITPAAPAPPPDFDGPTVKLPPGSSPTTPRDLLFLAAADLHFQYAGRDVTGREVESKLSPALKEALNAWAEPATRLGLHVLASGNPEALVLGTMKDDALKQAADWIDEATRLLDPIVAAAKGRQPRAIVAILFDEKSARSPAWTGLLDDLVTRRLMFETAAEGLRSSPSGLMLRGAGIFLQTTYDVAGNAAAGDDEFRLRNEVQHKFAQCLITSRCGQLPPTILWGLGEMVELRLTQSVYMFNTTGFVATADHTDWPARTKKFLEKRLLKKRGPTLSADALQDAAAGRAVEAQMCTWAALGWMADKQPARLRDLLIELADLHVAADPHGRSTVYRGDADKTGKTLAQGLDVIDLAALVQWLDEQH